MSLTFALVGNPNCGKTTIFNALTGGAEYVGNWPGVTVEQKEGRLLTNRDVLLIDLPGTYSLNPHSPDEQVTHDFLYIEKPDAIINVVDASNLERNLFLTTELLELDIPVVIVLNMMDIVSKNGDKIQIGELSALLQTPIVDVSATHNDGISEISQIALTAVAENRTPKMVRFSKSVEEEVLKINKLVGIHNRSKALYLLQGGESVSLEPLSDEKTAVLSKIVADNGNIKEKITKERYAEVDNYIKKVYTSSHKRNFSDSIDKVVTNPIFAIPILVVVMFAMYFLVIEVMGSFTTELMENFFIFLQNVVNDGLTSINSPLPLQHLLVNGIIGGVGAVLTFIPQLLFLFLFMAVLEDCGYMARVAFIMDHIFRKFGLSGKAFIPLIISSGCGVPAIMASRTIENLKDRRLTIMVTTFIPCGAKLPVIALFGSAIFGGAFWIAPLVYFVGVASVIISSIILKRTPPFKGEAAPFIMELPVYHVPPLKAVLTHTWERGKSVIVKAGTVILLACVIIWTLQSFTWNFQYIDVSTDTNTTATASENDSKLTIDDSILAGIGNFIAPVFTPLGFGSWQPTVATLTGFAAKENIVSTLQVIYGSEAAISDNFTKQAALAFIIFNMLCMPCVAAVAAIRREMHSLKWTFAAISYQTVFAYIVALLINQIGGLILC